MRYRLKDKDLDAAMEAFNEGVGSYEEALTVFEGYMHGYESDGGHLPGRMHDINEEVGAVIIEALQQQIQDDKRTEQLQDLSKIDDALEPIKVYFALRSLLLKLEVRKQKDPEEISILDYTIIRALDDWLKKNAPEVYQE